MDSLLKIIDTHNFNRVNNIIFYTIASYLYIFMRSEYRIKLRYDHQHENRHIFCDQKDQNQSWRCNNLAASRNRSNRVWIENSEGQ